MSVAGVCQRVARRPDSTAVLSRPLGVVENTSFRNGYSYSCSYHYARIDIIDRNNRTARMCHLIPPHRDMIAAQQRRRRVRPARIKCRAPGVRGARRRGGARMLSAAVSSSSRSSSTRREKCTYEAGFKLSKAGTKYVAVAGAGAGAAFICC